VDAIGPAFFRNQKDIGKIGRDMLCAFTRRFGSSTLAVWCASETSGCSKQDRIGNRANEPIVIPRPDCQEGETMSRISAAACLLFVASSAAFSVRAQSQSGGVPSLDVRVTTLETTVGALQTTLTTLQNTVTTLQAANSNLQKALSDEITARVLVDFKLASDLAKETDERKFEDSVLSGAIESLKTAGIGAKVYSTFVLHGDVPNGNLTTVATLSGLPAGKYLVLAKGNVSGEHDQVWGCFLNFRSQLDWEDQIIVATEGVGVESFNSVAAVALSGIVTLGAPGQVTMSCESGHPGSEVDNIRLTALQVV
jgi:hypothetical protein